MSAPDPLQRLLAATEGGAVRLVSVAADGSMAEQSAGEPASGAVLPGSFNPLHDGHLRLAAVVVELLAVEIVFELSVANVDKPPLAEAEVRRRLAQFSGRGRVVLTRAPTFVEKARLLPGRTFAIGWDTAVRLVHPRYYGDDERAMREALAEMRSLGCRVLVAGRAHEGVFRTLDDAGVPPQFADLFEAIPESRFRVDVSSSALRDG